MANNYDTKISYIEDDIKKIQTKPNLYIQKYGALGIFHLFKELVQNSIDEYSDPACIAYLKTLVEKIKKLLIKITYDRLSGRATIEDWGRGIPEDDYSVEIVCTKNQSGSKFYRDQGGASSGEFGVGMTVVNALSSEFSITTYRNTYYHTVSFKDGVKISEEKGKTKSKKHGTVISFIPNPLYLGVGSSLPLDTCIDWMETMSYQVSDDIQFEVEEYNGLELLRELKIRKKPFSDLIYKFIPDDASVAFGPVAFSGNGTIDESITKNTLTKSGKVKEVTEVVTKWLKLEFAFAYDLNTLEYGFDAFCNFTQTDEGGVHVDTVEDVLSKYIQSRAMDSMTDAQKEKYPVTRQDVRSGLKLVVNLSTNAQVQFMGNAKNKIQRTELIPVLKDIAKKLIEDYFNENSGKLADVIKIVRDSAKARIDLQKMRSVAVKGRNTRFDDLQIENFVPCNNNKPGVFREIFLIEGKKSAGGSMSDGRDTNTQAIYGFRGQTLNPYKTTFAKFMENVEWRNYFRVLKCGIGASFDIRKLHYKKINITTDADIDGHGIAVGMASTHALYVPEIVKAGMLYRIYPPLYEIANKENRFIGNKKELVDLYQKEVIKRYKIAIGTEKMSTNDMWRFLYDIVDYRFILGEILQPFYKVPVQLIEAVAATLVICDGIDNRGKDPVLKPGIFDDPKFIRNFMQLIQKRFPEIVLSGKTIQGVAQGITASMEITDGFVDKMEQLIPIYQKYGYIILVREGNLESIPMSILDFCDMTHSLTPKILHRFKGLGECDPEDLWHTVLNPANRISVQLTFDNIERDMEIFRKLKSNKPIYVKQRAEMVDAYKIRYDDIDN